MSAAIEIGIPYPTPPMGISPERCVEQLASAIGPKLPQGVEVRLTRRAHPQALIRIAPLQPPGTGWISADDVWQAAYPTLTRIIVGSLQHEWVHRRFRARSLAEDRCRRQIETRVRHMLRSATHDGWLRATVRSELQRLYEEQQAAASKTVAVPLRGFIRFRLRACVEKIDALLDDARAHIAHEIERGELMQLLQQFVADESITPGFVDVVRREGGRYQLLDPDRNVVETEYLRGDVFDLVHTDSDRIDLLFSALITLMPQALTCHFDCEPIVKSQLRQLFGARIQFCRGCDLCVQPPRALTPAARSAASAAEKISPPSHR